MEEKVQNPEVGDFVFAVNNNLPQNNWLRGSTSMCCTSVGNYTCLVTKICRGGLSETGIVSGEEC